MRARRGGLLISDPDTGQPRYPGIHVQLRCFVSGRVIEVGQVEVSSTSYQTLLLAVDNDIDPVVDGWAKLACILTRTDNEPGNLFCTAVELRGLDPGARRTHAAGTSQPRIGRAATAQMSVGKVTAHAG
jgi:hypothetical protein